MLAQKRYALSKYQNERDVARRLRRFGHTRKMKKEVDSQDLVSSDSCRSSVVHQVEEMSLESPRKSQDVQAVMSEPAGKATRGRGKYAWRLEQMGNGDAGNQSCFERGGRRPPDTLMVKVAM